VELGDGPAIHTLLTSCIPDVLPDSARWLARWRWQYWENPFRRERPAGYVLADGDRVLGHLGAVHLPLRFRDAHVSGSVGADYAVCDEAVARGGMFAALELAQRLFADCKDCVVMATTANEKTGAVFGRFGCREVGWTREFWRASTDLPQQIRSCCGSKSRLVRRAINGRYGRWVAQALVACHQITGRLPPIPISRGCSLETTVPQLACDLGQLWESIWTNEILAHQGNPKNSRISLAVHRSQAYLEWRYARHPERDRIRVMVVRNREHRLLGAAVVFREERADRHVLYIEELLVVPHRRDVERTLLCAALRLARQGGAEYLVTSPGRRSIRHLYWELGFEDRARNAPAVVFSLPAHCDLAQSRDPAQRFENHIEFWHGMMF
jgi:hypothetical protein